jgi:hypothetical protein
LRHRVIVIQTESGAKQQQQAAAASSPRYASPMVSKAQKRILCRRECVSRLHSSTMTWFT